VAIALRHDGPLDASLGGVADIFSANCGKIHCQARSANDGGTSLVIPAPDAKKQPPGGAVKAFSCQDETIGERTARRWQGAGARAAFVNVSNLPRSAGFSRHLPPGFDPQSLGHACINARRLLIAVPRRATAFRIISQIATVIGATPSCFASC
jgi:hypothetical protein